MQETIGITIDSGETATNTKAVDQSLRYALANVQCTHSRLGRSGAATSRPSCTTDHIYVFPARVWQAVERPLLKC